MSLTCTIDVFSWINFIIVPTSPFSAAQSISLFEDPVVHLMGGLSFFYKLTYNGVYLHNIYIQLYLNEQHSTYHFLSSSI